MLYVLLFYFCMNNHFNLLLKAIAGDYHFPSHSDTHKDPFHSPLLNRAPLGVCEWRNSSAPTEELRSGDHWHLTMTHMHSCNPGEQRHFIIHS